MADKPLPPRLGDLIERRDSHAFLVDFDGTIVDLASDPEDIEVPPELIKDIDNVVKSNAAFAIVTGRTIGRLDSFLGGVIAPVIGSHGAEHRPDPAAGINLIARPIPAADRNALRHVAKKHHCIFEDKLFSLSIHLPFDSPLNDLTPELVAGLGDQAGKYAVRRAGRTYEVLQPGITKGTGIASLMQHPAYLGRKPVYIGDDVHTDDSLKQVTDMGGVLLAVRHQHAEEANKGNDLLEVADVRKILRHLGHPRGR